MEENVPIVHNTKGLTIKIKIADLTIVVTCKNYFQMESAKHVLNGQDQKEKKIEFASMICVLTIK